MIAQPVLTADLTSRTRRDYGITSAALLTLLCASFSAMRWLKIESFWGDAPRWIFETWRVALGELPYRDFTWQYPPLSLLILGALLRAFGMSFLVLQVAIDLVSTAIVLEFWGISRLLLPPGLALVLTATLACAGAGNTNNFALFSLRIYTPALLVGMAGFLMMLEPLIMRIVSGSFGWRGGVLLSLGGTIALLSKPEFATGVAGALLAVGIYEGRLNITGFRLPALWFRRQALLLGLTVLPGLGIYGLLAWRVGLGNLMAGISGYGMAYLVCPWWPTGLGLFGAVVALCQGAAVLLVLRWLSPRASHSASTALRVGALLAIPATILYFPYCIKEFPIFAHGTTPANIVSFFLSTGCVLLPVMWCSIVGWPALAFGFGSARRLSHEVGILLTLSTSGLLMSIRSLFGGTLNQLTLVTVADYPIWFILGPILLQRSLDGADNGPIRRAPIPVLMLVTVYAFLRFGAAVGTELRSHYGKIDTAAGKVQVSDYTNTAAVYRYVVDRTSSSDGVLDVAYGGAVNFASRRTSALYSTQFSGLAPAQKYLDMDLDRIRAHPPKLVIANQQPDSGAEYGLCTETGCMFPMPVWRPTRLACDPNRKFPVLEFIKQNYAPVARIGQKTIYVPKANPSAPN
jgi:hypothetical protein